MPSIAKPFRPSLGREDQHAYQRDAAQQEQRRYGDGGEGGFDGLHGGEYSAMNKVAKDD
jgi:hypothetical protein